MKEFLSTTWNLKLSKANAIKNTTCEELSFQVNLHNKLFFNMSTIHNNNKTKDCLNMVSASNKFKMICGFDMNDHKMLVYV
jgi:hypothetical protein